MELLNKQHYILVQVETSSDQRACGEPELKLQASDAFSTLGVCQSEADSEMRHRQIRVEKKNKAGEDEGAQRGDEHEKQGETGQRHRQR